jgi:hypothetical protein
VVVYLPLWVDLLGEEVVIQMEEEAIQMEEEVVIQKVVVLASLED